MVFCSQPCLQESTFIEEISLNTKSSNSSRVGFYLGLIVFIPIQLVKVVLILVEKSSQEYFKWKHSNSNKNHYAKLRDREKRRLRKKGLLD